LTIGFQKDNKSSENVAQLLHLLTFSGYASGITKKTCTYTNSKRWLKKSNAKGTA